MLYRMYCGVEARNEIELKLNEEIIHAMRTL